MTEINKEPPAREPLSSTYDDDGTSVKVFRTPSRIVTRRELNGIIEEESEWIKPPTVPMPETLDPKHEPPYVIELRDPQDESIWNRVLTVRESILALLREAGSPKNHGSSRHEYTDIAEEFPHHYPHDDKEGS
jgi:hypothetical protein